MKKLILINVLLLLSMVLLHAQDEAAFKMALSSDTILMGNFFEVKFSLKNGSGSNFSPPSFDGFDVVGGPNQSSSLSIVNGVKTQRTGFSFYLQPREVGNYYIEAASIEADGVVLETQPTEIIVLPNPDGEKADYSVGNSRALIFGEEVYKRRIGEERKENWKKKRRKTRRKRPKRRSRKNVKFIACK